MESLKWREVTWWTCVSGRRPRPSRRALQWPPAESASRAADHWASAAQFVWRCKTLHVRQAREWSFRLVTRSVNVAAVLDSTFGWGYLWSKVSPKVPWTSRISSLTWIPNRNGHLPSILVNFALRRYSGEQKAPIAPSAAQFESPRPLHFVWGSTAKTE